MSNVSKDSFKGPLCFAVLFWGLSLSNSLVQGAVTRVGAEYFLEVVFISALAGLCLLLYRLRNTKYINEKSAWLKLVCFILFPFSITLPLIEFFPELIVENLNVLSVYLYAAPVVFYLSLGWVPTKKIVRVII